MSNFLNTFYSQITNLPDFIGYKPLPMSMANYVSVKTWTADIEKSIKKHFNIDIIELINNKIYELSGLLSKPN
jgi:hypothetical protein